MIEYRPVDLAASRVGMGRFAPTLLALCALCCATVNISLGLPIKGASVPTGPGADATAAPIAATGRAFDDAVRLKALLVSAGPSRDADIAALLKAHDVDPAHLDQNPFLRNVPSLVAKFRAPVSAAPIPGAVTAQGNPMSSLFSASSIADALGSLIAERVKEDAELIFIRSLARQMKTIDASSAGKPLTAGFPRSMGYLRTVDSESIDTNDWVILQSDFRADFAALPQNLPAFVDALYDPSIGSEPRYLTSVAAVTGIEIIRNGRQPYDVIDAVGAASTTFIASFSGAGKPPPQVSDVDAVLKLASIVSHLLAQDGKSTWHSKKDVDHLLFPAGGTAPDPDALNLWLGLSYAADTSLYDSVDRWLTQKGKPPFTCARSTSECSAPAQFATIAAVLEKLAGGLVPLHQDVQNLPLPVGSIDDAKPLIGDLMQLANGLCDAALAFDPSIAVSASKSRVARISVQLNAIVDIIGDVKERQYASAVGEIVTFLRLDTTSDTSPVSKPLAQFFQQNGPFLAEVAAAKTPDDIKAAFETHSLSATSYNEIQHGPFSVTLNSYFGVTAGAETLIGNLQGTGAAKTRAHLGFTAPVGLDFNWGLAPRTQPIDGNDPPHDSRFFQTGSWSLFLPILDVGAVASWRLGSGGGQVSSLTWPNIVAPGLFVVWSKKGSPLSILFGAQYGPELTKISTGGGNTIQKPALQFPAISFTFDIPIFNLYEGAAPAKR
jgi:hypothetical protein